jgi:conjugal transfer/type IV secretion protein DotA/TraY
MKKWMFGLLTALFPTLLFSQQANQASAVETGGFGKWLIDSLFESGSIGNMAQQPGMIGTVIMPLSLMCFIVVLFLIVLKSLQHLIVVAQAKTVDASPVSMTWAPIHILMAVALVLPMPSGYSIGQYGGIWLAEQSNNLGNITASKATSFIENRGIITPPPMPSMQDFTNAIAMSSTCKVMFNKYGEHMRDLGNVGTTIVEVQRQGQLLPGTDNVSQSEEYDNYLINYARTIDGGATLNSSGLNDFCGKMAVKYKKPPSGDSLTNALPVFRVDPSECADGESNFCFSEDNAVAKALYDNIYAINTLVSEFLIGGNGVAVSGQSTSGSGQSTSGSSGYAGAITTNLLYDVDLRLAGATDADKLQQAIDLLSEEDQRIDIAVAAAEDLYEQLRDRVYDAYAQAINENNTNGAAGDWIENLDRAGWPVLGLYWFQFTNTSDSVAQASQMSFTYSGNMNGYLDALYTATEDEELVRTLRNRYAKFQRRFSDKIQNTRFDTQPMVDESRSDTASLTGITAEELKELNAADLSEQIPAMLNTMRDQAGNGNDNVSQHFGGDFWAYNFLNDWSRTTVFPLIVDTLKDGDIVSSMVNAGHMIVSISETIYVAQLTMGAFQKSFGSYGSSGDSGSAEAEETKEWSIWGLFTNPIDTVVSALAIPFYMLAQAVEDFSSYWKYIFFAGIFLAYYLPAMIMIQWMIGFVTWIIYLLEATVIIPIWGILFVGEMGEKSFSPQTARQGFVHFLSILLYPSLMVIGFVFGLKVIDLISPFLIDFLVIGLLNATDGYAFGLLSFAASLILLAIAAYQIIVRIFSIVLEFNDRAMSWIGQRVGYGEAGGEQGTRGGFVGAINETKMDARMGGGKKGGKG